MDDSDGLSDSELDKKRAKEIRESYQEVMNEKPISDVGDERLPEYDTYE